MIKIDKHNIEAHYLDYLEGNLSVEDTGLLMSFIDNNPEFADLFDDTEDLMSIQLEPSSEKFGDVDDLKIFPCGDDEICMSNIDYWLVAKAEKTLNASEIKAVDVFVIENKLEKNEAYIGAAYLTPDLTETFGNVSVLKKKGGTIIPMLLRFTSAAAIFLFIWLAWNPNQSIERKYSSRLDSKEVINEVEYISPELIRGTNIAVIDPVTVLKKQSVYNSVASATTKKQEEKPKVFSDFPMFTRPLDNISVPVEYALVSSPKIFSEDIDISSIFSDFEETIAINNAPENNDFSQVNPPKSKYELQEQYKPVTSRLSNLTSLSMSVKKMPEASDVSQTVIQIGKFSFDRKKNK